MKPRMKTVRMAGVALAPVEVGSRALLLSGGKIIWTTQVVAVYKRTESELRFETLNTTYQIKLSPFPRNDCAALPVSMAA